jgi:translocation and assembly module TamB
VGEAQVAVEAPARAEGGQSNLKVHAESPNLATIARLFDQPLSGVARLDATVTGNRREYRASGNLNADGLKFDRNGALNATTDFEASLTALDPATVTVSGTTRATLVTIAGQNLDEMTARTRYAHREIDFDVAASQPERSLAAEGSLLLQGEGVDVFLTSLALRMRDAEWQTAAGTRPAIQYSADAISVADLQLSNGQQNISVNGKFGGTGDTLTVTVADVDVATIDQLLLRQPQSTGRLNASARITGTRAAPSVTGDFAIAQGGLRQLRYDSLGGSVRYENNGLDIDVRLQQNPTTWMVVKGYAPLAPEATRTDYDLHIDSSPIELGLLQPLIPSVTNLTGTMQAKVDVTGPSGNPRPLGAVTIANGSFKVLPTGVSYSQLEGRIDLLPEKVHIGELGLADSRGKRLTITGDLAIREREVAGVAIEATATDFKIVDNKMGSLRINTNLRIAGELSAPRINGDLAIATGQINLDPIVAALDDAAYGTQESAFVKGPDASQRPASTPIRGTPIGGGASTPIGGEASAPLVGGAPGGVFDPLQMYVHLTAPNALVIKANDLRAPGALIGLGALNVTVGSDLYISKSPWDQVRLIGTVNTVRGTYDFQGRRFTILRDGRIRFEGLDDVDAALDIRAERVIQGVTANVNVRGRLKQPELALSSTPPLEEADILALIVFNQPINQLGEGQVASLSSLAGSMALGAAVGPLTQSIGNALSLNTFELNVAPESGRTADVTIGQQVGQNLYVKLQQGIGDQGQTNLVLEYELTRWLRFRTNLLQGSSAQTQLFQRTQSSGVDLLFFFSY